ncbi:uncharacterized protein N7496_000497 [Penicillium cataractarum]|uniref:Heterokaryon incompatibility domain-containing protein n=1 Tax=Penicillium cataractarum TaxID=2100454 RepID=A0A9W9VUK3_9EURO|nr:uncharacterized protein N7496_000497 [Penicillium cataractarum]KAJ5389429.1 hypothetical protein N7496_000497 [Penicillium cataractarum]
MKQPKELEDGTAHAKTVQVAQDNTEDIYTVLPPHHIRVLDLLPGSELDLIEVQLSVVQAAAPGAYKALSYVCGSTTEDLYLILCNGSEFMITSNLYAALIRFRHPTETQRLWVDAICIHQGSISERSQQVRMMSQIYHRAEEVLLWLGNDDPDINVKRAFELVHTREDYVIQCTSLDRPPGSTVVLLHIPDPDLFDIIAEVQQRFGPPTFPSDHHLSLPQVIEGLLSQSWIDYPESPLLMHIGCRHIEEIDTSNVQVPILGLAPDWDIDHVRRVASESFATFVDFLKEATKPAELRLSDKEAAEVFSAVDYLLGKPYFQRAWIVQEIILARKATLVCGKHEADFQGFKDVFGFDQHQSEYMQNFSLDDFKYFDVQGNWQKLEATIPLMTHPQGQVFPLSYLAEPHHVFNQMAYLRYKAQEEKLGLFDIGALLEDFPQQKSTDPRDLIFSLVGILQKFSKRPNVLEWAESCVDYSLDVREVYLRTAKHLVELAHDLRLNGYTYAEQPRDGGSLSVSHHILDFFAKTTEPLSEQFNLPTWVPNWSASTETTVFDTRRIRETEGLIPFDGKVQGDSLLISGCIVDEVTFCSEILPSEISKRHNGHMFQEVDLCDMLVEKEHEKRTRSVYGGFDAQFEGFWRTIIADNPIGIKPFSDHTYHFKEHDEVNEWLAQCQVNYRRVRQTWGNELKYRPMLGPALARVQCDYTRPRNVPPAPVDDDKIQNILGSIDKIRLLELLEQDEPQWRSQEARCELSTHVLIKTKQGYFGLAPPSIQRGDIVAHLAACVNPWYLRRQGQHYTLVGKGWVHGLMYKADAFYRSEAFRDNCGRIELR